MFKFTVGALGDTGVGQRAVEAVRRARIDVKLARHASVAQASRVFRILVGKAIERANTDKCRWQVA
jgi:hypothetical protein